MTKDEALRMALEALEWNLPIVEDYGVPNQLKIQHKAITAIYQILEQPKCNPHPDAPHGYDRTASIAEGRDVCECESWQPKREWVGLTDEEISVIVRGTHNTGSFVRAIEAKLKEKNNG